MDMDKLVVGTADKFEAVANIVKAHPVRATAGALAFTFILVGLAVIQMILAFSEPTVWAGWAILGVYITMAFGLLSCYESAEFLLSKVKSRS